MRTRIKELLTAQEDFAFETTLATRSYVGLRNFFTLYQPLVDSWMLIDNSGQSYQVIAKGAEDEILVTNQATWKALDDVYHG